MILGDPDKASYNVLGVVADGSSKETSATPPNCKASVMSLLQKVLPLACDEASKHVHERAGGNQARHIPTLSKPRAWLVHALQNSRQASYSFAETPRLTTW
jgi:hypothetical protein